MWIEFCIRLTDHLFCQKLGFNTAMPYRIVNVPNPGKIL